MDSTVVVDPPTPQAPTTIFYSALTPGAYTAGTAGLTGPDVAKAGGLASRDWLAGELGLPQVVRSAIFVSPSALLDRGEGLQEPRSLGLRCVEYEGVQLGWHLRRRPKRLLVCGDMVIDMMQ